MNYKDIELSYGNMTLKYENHETVKQLGIQQGSTLTMIGLVHGGMPTESDIQWKDDNLTPLPGYIEVTTSKDNPDIITFDDGASPKRAIMPCGHAISPGSMTEYILQTVMRYNKNEITCPSCGRNWPLNFVQHVACFSSEEWKDIESKIERLSLMKNISYQQCPGCQMWLKKIDDNAEVVNCWHCTSKNGVKFNFCWKCLHKTSVQTSECPKNCSTLRENRNILETCPMKTIGSEQCPSVRSCPNCKLLIHHIDKCKHMTCKCGCQFCFVCLKFSPPGKTFNSHYNIPCNLAARQLAMIQ